MHSRSRESRTPIGRELVLQCNETCGFWAQEEADVIGRRKKDPKDEKDKEKDKDREREREKDRDRERDKERDRERDRDREKDRRRRSASR